MVKNNLNCKFTIFWTLADSQVFRVQPETATLKANETTAF